MAYSSTNPAHNLAPRLGGGPGNLWVYNSSDTIAAIVASGYFANGFALGMKVKDFIFIACTTGTTSFAVGTVITVNASSAATVTVTSTTT